ncbi:hydroquinone glucosyltransferase, partial [Sarracenia purpurea var. burkii]
MGSFDKAHVKEIATALVSSSHRFLLALWRPPPKWNPGFSGDYKNPNEVMLEG